MNDHPSVKSLETLLGEEVGSVRTEIGDLKGKLGEVSAHLGKILSQGRDLEGKVRRIRQDRHSFHERVQRVGRRIRHFKSILATYQS